MELPTLTFMVRARWQRSSRGTRVPFYGRFINYRQGHYLGQGSNFSRPRIGRPATSHASHRDMPSFERVWRATGSVSFACGSVSGVKGIYGVGAFVCLHTTTS